MIALAMAVLTHLQPVMIPTATTRSCPYGDVQFVRSPALADLTVRFVRSRAKADCVLAWVTVAPGPGQWREVDSWPDMTVYATDGFADLTVYVK